jgi:hypothetical protein
LTAKDVIFFSNIIIAELIFGEFHPLRLARDGIYQNVLSYFWPLKIFDNGRPKLSK